MMGVSRWTFTKRREAIFKFHELFSVSRHSGSMLEFENTNASYLIGTRGIR